MKKLACEIRGLEKAFGPNKVLRKIDLDLFPGEVTVLMGANGAGKSTLVKILCGVHQSDGGSINLFGKLFRPKKPVDAFNEGVVTVHQSINDGVVPDLDVASNLMLDRLTDKKSGFFVSEKNLRIESEKIAEIMGLSFESKKSVSELGVADRQLIAIARAMSRNPKVLILDEPTSSLSAKEADRLFKLLDRLRSTNVAILYISHRMSDIRQIADKIICMRDGSVSGIFAEKPLDYEGAVTAMIGHKMTEVNVKIPEKGKEILNISDLRLDKESLEINLKIYQNEVVAVTGLLGSGKTQLASILFGVMKQFSGKVYLNGNIYSPSSPLEAIKLGVHMSPKDRSSNAVIKDFDIERNLTIPFLNDYAWLSLLNFSSLKNVAKETISDLGIVCQSENDDIETLSGGNQQKVVVARELSEDPILTIASQPTRGVDIGNIEAIHEQLVQMRDDGGAVLLVSAELDEVMAVADRVGVMYEGQIVKWVNPKEVDQSQMGLYMAGIKD